MFNAEREFGPMRFCGVHDVTKIEVCQQNLVVQLVTLKVNSVLKETDESESGNILYYIGCCTYCNELPGEWC